MKMNDDIIPEKEWKELLLKIGAAKQYVFRDTYKQQGKGIWLLYGLTKYNIAKLDPNMAVFIPEYSITMFINDIKMREEIISININTQIYAVIIYNRVSPDGFNAVLQGGTISITPKQ